ERNWRLIGEGDFEEIADHGSGDIASGLAMSERRRIVEADICADHEVRCEADEPGILLVVGGSGLARDRTVQDFELLRRATLDNAFHDVGHLVRRHRIDDLRPVVDELRLLLADPFPCRAIGAFAIVMLPDRPAVAVLDTVDKRRFYLLAAI